MIHIVDDEETVREVLAEMVEALGKQTMLFSDSREYLKYVHSGNYQKPTAIFTDIDMPNMNGYEMIGETLKIYPGVNFAVISGNPYFEHPSKNAACIYLKKPFKPEVLEEVIKKFDSCLINGPSETIDCSACGDRHEFGLAPFLCRKKKGSTPAEPE